jgi:hypothetical protein
MGYEIEEIKEVILYDKDTGEEVGRINPPITVAEDTVTMVWEEPPKPNIKFIISPGQKDGKNATNICFYRPKEYNWFQRFMYKICFGITIKQGNEVRREFL